MGIIATKKATRQLQKIFDFLGEYGGTIETKNPDNWWKLDLEVGDADETSKRDVAIGVCNVVNGDVLFDPQFTLNLKMDGLKITEVEIEEYESNSVYLGTRYITDDDMIHDGFGSEEKASPGLKRRFSDFMTNMTEVGPYLTDPKAVKRYTKTLAEW